MTKGPTVIWAMPPHHARIISYLVGRRLRDAVIFSWANGVCYIMVPRGIDLDTMRQKLRGVEFFEDT